MHPPRLGTAVRLAVGLALLEGLGLGVFHLARPGYLVPGAIAIAGFYLAVAAVCAWGIAHRGLAWPFSYATALGSRSSRRARDPQYARLYAGVDSYLTNTSSADELHEHITSVARWRLARHHGIDLDDRAAAEPVLGKELAAYLYSPPARTLRGRSRARLTTVLTRIEEL